MVAIGIEYLCGVVRATHVTSRDRAEWPPHPDRVFMALVAAHFETDGPRAERIALEWLERQGPPAIYASACQTRTNVTSYVPVNDSEIARKGTLEKRIDRCRTVTSLKTAKAAGLAILPESRPRQPRTFATAIPDDPMVYLHWQSADAPDEIRSALTELCFKVAYLGHSASLVQMWVEDQPPEGKETNWVPDERHVGKRLRISGPGRLARLEQLFNQEEIEAWRQLSAGIEAAKGKRKNELKAELKETFGDSPPQTTRPTPSLWQAYSCPAPRALAAGIATSVLDHNVFVLRRVGGRQFGLESTLQVCAALRDTAMTKCLRQPPPEWISGHKPDRSRSEVPHVAFVPLANVGYEHSDGRLLGAAIFVPRAVEPAEVRLLNPLIGYDDRGDPVATTLVFGALGEWVLQPEDRDERPVTLRECTWTGWPARGHRRWATVTPIVFDRHPKERERAEKKWSQIESMIADACERIDLPRPADVIPSPVSMFVGSPHARRFPLMQRKGGGNLHHTHAIITFDQPVLGPVLLGAGRYRGYGLCRPLQGEGVR